MIRAISYGGGVQSTALLVLAATGRIDYQLAVMANVGDDSEHPATLRYVREIAAPYAADHGIELHLLDRMKRDGTVETLWGRLMDPIRCRACKGTGRLLPADIMLTQHCTAQRCEFTLSHTAEWCGTPQPTHCTCAFCYPQCPRCEGAGKTESKSLPIPVRMSNGAPGSRSCTADFKIRVTGKFFKARGATDEDPATVAIGISVDEIHRANNRRTEPHERIVYPLVSVGDDTGLRLNRADCARIIADAGLPVPPKSSCFFCPFHRATTWQDQAREEPELFARSVELEDTLNARRRTLGKDPIYLTRYGIPLREAIGTDQPLLPLADDCDGGWCHT